MRGIFINLVLAMLMAALYIATPEGNWWHPATAGFCLGLAAGLVMLYVISARD